MQALFPSPLIGQNIEKLGTRFPDMTHIYDEELQHLIRETAAEERVPLREGVYLQTTGPNFESPAEVKMYGLLGADAVGMSTACEAVAGKTCGNPCMWDFLCVKYGKRDFRKRN